MINKVIKEKYLIKKEISKGSFGSIYEGINKNNGLTCAIKVIEKNLVEDFNKKRKKEKFYLDMLYCNFSNHYKEDFEDENYYYLILELCDDNLLNYYNKIDITFSIEIIRKILLQINTIIQKFIDFNISCFSFLNLSHFFIKFKDEFNKNEFNIKLGNFGFNKEININDNNNEYFYYAPPEKFDEQYSKDEKKEFIYSLGIIIYYLLFKEYPFNNKEEIINHEINLKYEIENQNLKNLLFSLLDKNPNNRLNFIDYLNHPFFKENLINFSENDFNNLCKKYNSTPNEEIYIKKIENKKFIYYGEISKNSNKFHGRGFFYNKKNNILYKGLFEDNLAEGLGEEIYFDETKFEGEFKEGLKNGKGKFYYTNGNIFEGEFINNIGYGKIEYKNGDVYNGEFLNGNKHGFGKYYYKNGNKYEGEYFMDQKIGKGISYSKEQNKYEGHFLYNKFNGYGILSLNNGDIYKGNFKNNKFNGKGTYLYSNGDIYEGDWKKNKREGKGIMKYFNTGNEYNGDWKDDKRMGYGIFIYKEGDKYEGEFNDVREGKGKMIYSNGDIYEGEFKNDLENGKGILYMKNGDKIMGEFKDGKKVE